MSSSCRKLCVFGASGCTGVAMLCWAIISMIDGQPWVGP